MAKTHSRLSPSATRRWLNCPGSIELSRDVPREESSYAAEGTHAHDIAEDALVKGVDAKELSDNPDVVEAVQEYLDEIRAVRSARKPEIEYTERQVQHPRIKELGGTPDHYMMYQEGQEIVLHVFDYKHGVGVIVDAEENAQVLSYFTILGAMYLWLPTIYRATIVQPRAAGDSVDHWETKVQRILEHEQQILTALQNSDKFHAGDWCRWCPALQKCEEVRNHANRVAATEFDDIVDDTDELLELMRVEPAIRALLDRIPGALLRKFETGQPVPGYKVVERLSHRRWTCDQTELEPKLVQLGLKREDYIKESLESPAQIEKKLPKEQKKELGELTERVRVGYSVVPESDRRKPVDLFAFPEFD